MFYLNNTAMEPSTHRRTSRQRVASTSASFRTLPISRAPAGLYRKSDCSCGGTCPRCQSDLLLHQANVRIGSPGDRYEQEADRVAERIVADNASRPMLQQSDAVLQKKSASARHTAEAISPRGRVVSGQGELLPTSVRTYFESRMGYDFRHVRIHRDKRATTLAEQLQARAFTLGRDIVFGESQYQPATRQGKRLLAHELVHVMQQGQHGGLHEVSAAPPAIQRETATFAESQDKPCSGWESDRESFTKRVAEYYVMDALGTSGRGITLNCFPNNTVCIWTVQTPTGTISVAVSLAQMPGRVIARQVYVQGGIRCEYDYTCTPKGDLILSRHNCR